MFTSFDAVERDGLIIKSSCLNDQILIFFFDVKTKGFNLKVFMSQAAAASFLERIINSGLDSK